MLTDREKALFGPRSDKEPGSLEWCIQTLDLLKTRWDRKDYTIEQWEETLKELESVKAWEKVPPGYPDLEALIKAEIGRTLRQAQKEIRNLHSRQEAGKLGGRGNKAFLYKNALSRDEYLRARLKRDATEVFTRLENGEFASTEEAAQVADIIPKRIMIGLDPAAAARQIRKHFTRDQINDLIAALCTPD